MIALIDDLRTTIPPSQADHATLTALGIKPPVTHRSFAICTHSTSTSNISSSSSSSDDRKSGAQLPCACCLVYSQVAGCASQPDRRSSLSSEYSDVAPSQHAFRKCVNQYLKPQPCRTGWLTLGNSGLSIRTICSRTFSARCTSEGAVRSTLESVALPPPRRQAVCCFAASPLASDPVAAPKLVRAAPSTENSFRRIPRDTIVIDTARFGSPVHRCEEWRAT